MSAADTDVPDRESAPTPFLGSDPPAWAARALTVVLLTFFVAAGVASVVIRVPETVSGPFVLVPMRGVDPIRAPRSGTVVEVRLAEAQAFRRDDVLFVIRSGAVGEQSAELGSLETRVAGLRARMENERETHESQRLGDADEGARLDGRLAHVVQKTDKTRGLREIQDARYQARRKAQETELESLRREIAFKQSHLGLARELAERHKMGYDRGFLSWIEYIRPQIDAERVAVDLAQLERQLEAAELHLRQLRAERESEELEWTLSMRELETEAREVRSARDKLRHDVEARLTTYRELDRGLREELDRAQIRIAALRQALVGSRGSDVSIVAPCAGSLLRLAARAPAAVVREGETLAEVACAAGPLEAELTVPSGGVSRIRPGQGVKLLYDAFPYQRYGVRLGTVRWVSPASVMGNGGATFRALVTLADAAISIEGQPRALMAGMSGKAQVVIGRRPLIAYAFEPLRQLRENLAGAPGR